MIFLAFALCFLAAYCITKIKLKVFVKIIINLVSLLVFGGFMIVSGLKETAWLTYIILLVLTPCGWLMRIIYPVILNLAASFVAKITKQDYEWLTYDQLMEQDHKYKMHFCVLLFTTMKVALYLILVLSSIGLI